MASEKVSIPCTKVSLQFGGSLTNLRKVVYRSLIGGAVVLLRVLVLAVVLIFGSVTALASGYDSVAKGGSLDASFGVTQIIYGVVALGVVATLGICVYRRVVVGANARETSKEDAKRMYLSLRIDAERLISAVDYECSTFADDSLRNLVMGYYVEIDPASRPWFSERLAEMELLRKKASDERAKIFLPVSGVVTTVDYLAVSKEYARVIEYLKKAQEIAQIVRDKTVDIEITLDVAIPTKLEHIGYMICAIRNKILELSGEQRLIDFDARIMAIESEFTTIKRHGCPRSIAAIVTLDIQIENLDIIHRELLDLSAETNVAT